MKKVTAIAFFLLPIALWGQQLQEAAANTVQISQERLDRIDTYIQSSVDKGWVPGGVFLVARKGKIVYHKSFGFRDEGQGYKNDDIFRIASMTKAITSVAIMQLFEQGKLGLDDPIHWYLPAFKEMTVLDSFNEADSSFTTRAATKDITIRQLLTHTSGITYGIFNPGKIMAVYGQYDMLNVGFSHDTWTTEQFIDNLAKVPLVFEPGEKYLYGLNMDVLGRIIEVVSGQSLSQYFEENLFSKLGMADTFFYLPKNKHKRLVPVYVTTKDQGVVTVDKAEMDDLVSYPLEKDKNHYAGGGGLSSTAIDYAKFIQMLLNQGVYSGSRLLNPQTIDLINTDQMILLNREGRGYSKIPGVTYGLGFRTYTEEAEGYSVKSPGTYEWGGYFNTKYFIDPEEELIFVGMTQIVPFMYEHFWERLYTVIYGALED